MGRSITAAGGRLHKSLSTIRTRILLITISLILLIGIIIIAISYFIISYHLRQNLIQMSETRLSFLCASIDSNLSDVKSFVNSCRSSSKIRSFVMEEPVRGNRAKREAHDLTMEAYTSNSALPSLLIRMVIMGSSRKDIIQVVESPYSSVAVSSDAIRSLPYFELLRSHPGEALLGVEEDPFFTTKSIPMIPFVTPVIHLYSAEEVGYIYTEMSPTVITGPVRSYSSDTDSLFFLQIHDRQYQLDGEGLIPADEDFTHIRLLPDLALSPDTSIYRIEGNPDWHSYIFITKPLETKGWYVTECINETRLSQTIFHTFFLIALGIAAFSSIIGLILFRFLSRTVNVPVRQLQARIRRIEKGDFSRDAATEWPHELGDIGKTINDLSENVLLLMDQRLEDERQKRDYEYRMLQSQINPHFLYNTLNSIKWMATIQNSPGIAEMTTSLSRLLKDISKGSSSLVSIGHELSLARDYFTIQQYRYGGAITLGIRTEDEELAACQILKFTLQPLIENAIFHGIEPKGTAGVITIHIYREGEEDIRIDVTDDGIGIEPELSKRLLDQDSPTSSSFFMEVGISNVHKRIQYEFGNRYGLSIHSETGKFTTVSILLPLRKSEENYD